MGFTAISVGRGKSRFQKLFYIVTLRTSPCLVTGMSRACHGRHGEVGIMEFELNSAVKQRECFTQSNLACVKPALLQDKQRYVYSENDQLRS